MVKTDKQLLIEERAGMDIRDVLSQAYAEGQSLQAAAEVIRTRYGVPMTFGLFHDWAQSLGGEYRKMLHFPQTHTQVDHPHEQAITA